jgi:predicted small lipoprotein YifL
VQRLLVSLPRCAFVAALALALGLAGCGRKGALDPPPASAVEPAAQPGAAPGPNGQAAAAPNAQPGTPNRKLPIDWLLN